jgi:hypothetical protein
MAERVDAPVDAVQSERPARPADPAAREPEPQQLSVSRQPVLPLGQSRHRLVGTHFFPHIGDKGVLILDSSQGTSVRLRRIDISGCL